MKNPQSMTILSLKLRRLLLLCALCWSQISTRLIRVVPVKCRGKVHTNSGTFDAFFLGRSKLDVLESGDEETAEDMTICDVIPVPVTKQQLYDCFLSSNAKSSKTTAPSIDRQQCIAALSGIIGRDGGFFDNLPFTWRTDSSARKEMYSFLTGGDGKTLGGETISLANMDTKSFKRPEEALILCMKKILGCSIVGLILEVKDELGKDSVSLGAAAVLAKPESATEYTVSPTNTLLPVCYMSTHPCTCYLERSLLYVNNFVQDYSDLSSAPACVVNCKLDEVVPLSMASGIPIYIPKQLFVAAAVDAKLTKEEQDICIQYSVS